MDRASLNSSSRTDARPRRFVVGAGGFGAGLPGQPGNPIVPHRADSVGARQSPGPGRMWAVAPHTPGYLKEYEEINLLTATQLRGLFPEATVRTVGFPVLGNNLVAYYRRVI